MILQRVSTGKTREKRRTGSNIATAGWLAASFEQNMILFEICRLDVARRSRVRIGALLIKLIPPNSS
jgi:hypothetical protein